MIWRAIIARARRLTDPFQRISAPPPQSLAPFFLWCLNGAYPAVGLAVVVAIVSGSFEMLTAILLGQVIDTALASGPETVFQNHWPFLAAVTVFLLIVRPLVYGASSLLGSVVIGPAVNTMVLSRLHRWTLGQTITFFDNDFAGRIAQKSMQTARAVTDVTVETINSVLFSLASVVAATVLLVTIDWRLSLIIWAWILGYVVALKFFLPMIRARSAARAEARAQVTGQVVDTITNMRTVKLFAHAAQEDQAAIGAMSTFLDKAVAFGAMFAVFRLLLVAAGSLLTVVLVGTVLLLWTNGLATTGDIAATGAISLRLAQLTGFVSFNLMGIYSNVGEVEDGMRTLTPRPQITDGEDAVALELATPDIRFENVSFAYGRRAGGVTGIDLHIRAGEKVGIVGASGAGKSTLVSLALRLYDAEEGAVRVGGQDVRHVRQESLRQKIGMVTQETAMFNRTARENILYGRADASEAELIAAAKRAEAHEFITGLKDHHGNVGYEASLGERGVKLSGGQRQRIALARAILKDAPILVLDEATSALDSEVEAQIQTALERVMEGKTVLAIAHRLSTIARMDRIVVMEAGRIVEEGDHDSLLAAGGVYARFWARQSGAFLGAKAAAE
ncbi:MAG: ABC transporter ATP-binding protein [Pseudomonadota bacterium]